VASQVGTGSRSAAGSQGDSARGDFSGRLPEVIRPLLEFTSEFMGERAEAEIFEQAI